jgi:hypothetical protein
VTRRLPVVLGIVVALAALVAVDRVEGKGQRVTVEAPAPDVQPLAADPGARSDAWFCPGGPTDRVDQGDTTLVLANNGTSPVEAVVTALPSTGANKEVAVKNVVVGPAASLTVRLADLLGGAAPAGATVVAGPTVVAHQLLKAPEGLVSSPCASSASDHWYTAAGSTAAGTSHFLSLLNPFAGDAIADLAFSTDQGRTIPADLQGVLVPGRSLVVIDVGDKVRRRDEVAAEIVLRRGRLIVGRSYRKGTATSVAIASPSADATWYFPGGLRADGVTNRLVVANPSDSDAEVTAELRLQEGAAEPLTLVVPAQSRASLNLDDENVPKGVPYGLVVRTGNDVPVVVERSIETKAGRSDVFGSRLASRGWVSPASSTRGNDNLAVLNMGEGEAGITVTVLDGSGRTLADQPLRIAPGGRGSLKLADDVKGRALRITADQPVVVERDAGDGTATVGGAVAVPLSRA